MRQRLLSYFKRDSSSAPASSGNTPHQGTSLDELASAAPCCTLLSLDEMANAGNPNNMQMGKGLILDPTSTPTMAAMTGMVSYLGLAGVWVGKKIYDDFSVKEKVLAKELGKLTATLEDPSITQPQRHGYQAYQLYLTEQLERVKFQKFWAGEVSPVGSGGMVIGQAFTPLSPASLFMLSSVGVAHIRDMKRMYDDTGKQIARAQASDANDAAIRARHFSKERWHVLRNLYAWVGYTTGTASLGIIQAGAMTGSFMAPPAAAIASVSALAGGIVGTLVHNNIITNRFITGLPAYVKAMGENTPLSHEQVQQHNLLQEERRQEAKAYRATFWQQRSLSDHITHGWLRFRQKALAYSTVGLVDAFGTELKFKDKIRVTEQATKKMDDERIALLERLRKHENTQLAKPVDTKAARFDIEESTITAETNTDLGKLLHSILSSYDKGGIAKLLCQRVTEIKKGEAGGWMQKSPRFLHLRQEYAELFQFRQKGEKDGPTFENMTFLTELRKFRPCCNGNDWGSMLFEHIQWYYCDTATDHARATPEQKERMTKLLKEVTDQYLLFQLRKDAKERIAVWSNISDAYDRVREVGTQHKEEEVEATCAYSPLPQNDYTPLATAHYITKQEAQHIARTLHAKEPIPEGYIAFTEIMRHTTTDGSTRIVYQDPHDNTISKRVIYHIAKTGKLVVHYGEEASAIVIANKQDRNRITGVEIHTITDGQACHNPLATEGTGTSMLDTMEALQPQLPPRQNWEAYVGGRRNAGAHMRR